jgi:hypothetical protein
LEADGISSFALRVANLHASIPIQAGLDNATVNEVNHYGEIQLLKLNGAVTLPASEWAVRELLMNTALEVGTLGQAIGYTALGEVGVVSLGSGGGGADTNAVASVNSTNELVTLTGYTKAIVGNNTVQELYTKGYALTLRPGVTNEFVPVGTVSSNYDQITGVIRYTLINETPPPNLGFRYNAASVIGKWYDMKLEARGSRDGMIVTKSSGWDETVPIGIYGTTTPLTPWGQVDIAWKTLHYRIKAASNLGTTIYTGTNNVLNDWIEIRNYYFTESVEPGIDDGSTDIATTDSAETYMDVGDIYPDAISDGQTYGRKDGAWAVASGGAAQTSKTVDIPAVNYQFVPDTDVIIVNSVLPDVQGFDYVFTSQPIILPGTDGQYLTITNRAIADLHFTRGAGYGINSPQPVFHIDEAFSNVGYFRFNGAAGVWDAYGSLPIYQTGTEVNLLPAPWGPPDEDGNQTIRDDVQDALIDALLPRLLQRLGPAAGTLPAPAPAPRRMGKPGTRANPIDWPAAPEPAAAAGKYHININIGDQ